MSEPRTTAPGLPWRELIILPLVSLLTLLSLCGVAEIACRTLWPETGADPCFASDPVIGVHARPGCVTRSKAAEGPWAQEHWNECGNRSPGPCENKARDSVRVVVMGTSTSWGSLVPLRQTWFVRAANELRSRCGHEFDVQAMGGLPNLYDNAARLPGVLQLRPDAVVMILTPFDLTAKTDGPFDAELVGRPHLHASKRMRLRDQVREMISTSRTVLVVRHLLFLDSDRYISNYLSGGDMADYLRLPFSPAWRSRLEFVDAAMGYMAAKLRAAGVPLVVILAPNEAQAELAAGAARPPNVDPYALGSALGEIAARHDVVFDDATRRYAEVEHPEDTFYRVNGHFNSGGDAILGAVAADTLARVTGPASKPLCEVESKVAVE